jgi:hypothetical protein
MVEAQLIDVEIMGDIAGAGKWTFEPTDGKTKVKFEWDVKPQRLLCVFLSLFVDMGKIRSDVMQKGFEAYNSYLCKK